MQSQELQSGTPPSSLSAGGAVNSGNSWGVALCAVLGGGFLLAALIVSEELGKQLAAFGFSLLGVSFFATVGTALYARMRHRKLKRAARILKYDAAPTLVSDALGRVHYVNEAGHQRFPNGPLLTVADALQEVFAKPATLLMRLQAQASQLGSASEDVVTRRGHLRLTVHRFDKDSFLWRMEDVGAGPARQRSGTGLPMLTIGRGNVILFMNDAARQFCGARLRSLERVFPELPLESGGFALALSPEGPRNCLVHIVDQTMGRREVYFLPILAGDRVARGSVGDSALDLLPLAILRLDPVGQILGANEAAQTLLGIDMSEPRFLEDLLEGPGRPVRDWLKLALEESTTHQSEFLRVKQRGGDLFVQVSLTRVVQSDGRRLLAVLSDATAIKTLEEQFAQSQKMQAIGELAGGIAHDFNNLLTAISGHCDLLMQHRDEGDGDFADLVQIRQNANRAAALVGQLLAFSRKQTLRPEVLDLQEVLGDLGHLLNRLVGEKMQVVIDVDAMLNNMRADRRQLEQVMMNLVVNARDAMEGQGEVTITATNQMVVTPMNRDQVTVPIGEYLLVEVEDRGCGIAPEKLQKVFEPFYTTKRTGEGTGLGLATVYGIVKQSGGYVFVDSVEGEGTRFSLMFPAVQEPIAASPAPARPNNAQIQGQGVVLLVEDEAPVRAFASRALRLSGFTVIEAAHAEEALEILKDPALQVDVFLTDVIMPGLDGPTWVRQALEERPNVRVVFVSGYAEDAFDGSHDDIAQAQFLPKPFSLEALTETVQSQFLQ
ncbi:MAG: ATP-binding protein [Pseudomonadota bacterium]|nr:ATP-binding protein [Pseudomonadota bacterium]